MRGRVVACVAAAVALAGCVREVPREQNPLAGGTPTGAPTAATPVGDIDVDEAPCRGLGRVRRQGEITFVRDGRLYGVLADGSKLRCLSQDIGSGAIEWNAPGDQVVTSELRRLTRELNLAPSDVGDTSSVEWSRPEGTSVVYVSEGRLLKDAATGAQPRDISFLERHDEVTYHPAGEHIVSTGRHEDGTYGIFLATNEGTEDTPLAVAEKARRVYSLAFSHDGRTLYYAADHGTRFDVHGLVLTPKGAGKVDEAELQTLFSHDDPIDRVVVSEHSDAAAVAVAVGSCEAATQTTVVQAGFGSLSAGDATGEIAPLASRSTQPVGWLPDGTLAVMARDAGCDGPGDLYVWDGNEATLVAASVESPAVRAALPPPPGPPTQEPEVVA